MTATLTPTTIPRAEQMFPRLTPAQIARIASVGHRRDVRAGEVLFDVGDQNTRFFVVLSGAIDIVRLIGDREEPLVVHGEGQFTGEINMLSARRSLVRARMAGDGAVIAVDRDDSAHARAARLGAERDPDARLHPQARRDSRAGESRHGAARLAPLGQHAAHPRVPEPQRPALHLPGRRDRPERAGPARSISHRGRRRPGGPVPGRPRPQEPVTGIAGVGDRPQRRARRRARARGRHRGRRAGGARGRRLRRVRRAGRAGAREHRARRAGRHQLAHRKLPGLSHRHLGRGAGRARAHAGGEVRRRGGHRPHRRSPRLRQPALSPVPVRRAASCGRAPSSSPRA